MNINNNISKHELHRKNIEIFQKYDKCKVLIISLFALWGQNISWPKPEEAYIEVPARNMISIYIYGIYQRQKIVIPTNALRVHLVIERLRYPDSGLRVRVSPFCLPIFADVSIFTRNFYPFPRGKPWSTRKRRTGTGVFCLLFVGRLINSKKLQHLTQINNAHIMLVKVFNNLWRTSTVKVTTLSLVFSRRNILDFLSYKSFPDLRVRVRVYHPYP